MVKPQNGKKTNKKSKKGKKIVDNRKFKFKDLDGKTYILTAKQKRWCDVFLEEGANRTIASLQTYKITNQNLCHTQWKFLSKKQKKMRAKAEQTAAVIGQENLRKPAIYAYIQKTLSDQGYTDDVVRVEHFKNIKQDKNLTAKNTAIDMYYKTTQKYKPLEVNIHHKLDDEQLERIIAGREKKTLKAKD